MGEGIDHSYRLHISAQQTEIYPLQVLLCALLVAPRYCKVDLLRLGFVVLTHSLLDQGRLQETVAAAVRFQPNVVVTVDAKGFSFRVLSGLKGVFWCR